MEKLTNETFKNTISSNHLVLVDFYADWCGPCKMMHPVLEDLNNNNDKGLVVAQINVDDYPEIAGAYGVQSIPNMILFKDGQAASQLIGFMPKDALMAKLAPELD